MAEELRGWQEWLTPEGVKVIRLHYTADPDRDPLTPAGANWKALALKGIVDGERSNLWRREQEIDWTISEGKAIYQAFREATHVAKQILKPVRNWPILIGWDYGLCYSDDTEVLTDSGWKLFRDVDERNDLVATRNPETGKMTFTKINFKVDKPYKGKMLEWSSTEVNFCVTPEHRVPFTFRDSPGKVGFAEARWLADHMTGHHYVDLCSKWDPEYNSDQILFGMGTKRFAAFMGLYLSEGCVEGNRITIYQSKRDARFEEILGSGWAWTGSGWRRSIPGFSSYLKEFGNANQKRVPRAIKGMPLDLIREFIAAYTMGDGHVRTRANGATEHTIYTSSKDMAGDLQELAQKAGWNSSCRYVPPQESVIVEKGKERKINGNGGYQVTIKKRAIRAELLKKNFREIDYDGRIYCLNVPFHTLYVRRGGKPSWNGNTPAAHISQLTPNQHWNWYPSLYTAPGRAVGIKQFTETVQQYLNITYSGFQFVHYGDPAGNAKTQTDERTCFGIQFDDFGIMVETGELTWTARFNSMNEALRRLCDDGIAMLQIDPRERFVIDAMNGGYCKKRFANSDVYAEEPDKNEYSHIINAAEYVASRLSLVRPAPSRNPMVGKQSSALAECYEV
jgi:hypothetical protein